MGQQLVAIFDEARKLGGLPATIRLATLARISSIDARSMEDAPDKVHSLKRNYQIVAQEFGLKDSFAIAQTVNDSSDAIVRKLRKNIQVFSDIIATQSLFNSDVRTIAGQITSATADAVDVGRASIWFYNHDNTSIECIDLYERAKNQHSAGVTLNKSDFPKYFQAIANTRTLAAEDAHTHPGTAEFSEVYLKPLGINSMLDVPIFANGKMIGVVCHEHTGPKRKWTNDEENFAYLMGNIVGLAMERAQVDA